MTTTRMTTRGDPRASGVCVCVCVPLGVHAPASSASSSSTSWVYPGTRHRVRRRATTDDVDDVDDVDDTTADDDARA